MAVKEARTPYVVREDGYSARVEFSKEPSLYQLQELERVANGHPPSNRRRLPNERRSITHKMSIDGNEGYITAGVYEDGTLGEIFLTGIGKEGSTLRGILDSFAITFSIALQYGVPLQTLVDKFSFVSFQPAGRTENPEILQAKSLPDYIVRWLASRFLDADSHEELGVMTEIVKQRKIKDLEDGSIDNLSPTSLTTLQVKNQVNLNGNGNGSHSYDLGSSCKFCGGLMTRSGSCYTCTACGDTTGCG